MRLGRESELEIRDGTVVADRKRESEKTRQCKGKKKVDKRRTEGVLKVLETGEFSVIR